MKHKYAVIKTWKDREGNPRVTQPTVFLADEYVDARDFMVQSESGYLLVFPDRHEDVVWDSNSLSTPSFDMVLYTLV